MLLTLAILVAGPAFAQTEFVAFESGQVRPLALSPDGTKLFAVNTPDSRLEIFTLGAGGIVHSGSVAVGMEPVAVAARSDTEVWVVNHLSDSVSIVDLSGTPRVTRTLLVGDEPRDIVFAGGNRAFITTAHRGQQRTHATISTAPGAGDPQLTDDVGGDNQVGRADVWVFDAADLDQGAAAPDSLGGIPEKIVVLFGDTPRALAVKPADPPGQPDDLVYVGIFHSGNQTTVVAEGAVCNGGAGAASCALDGITSPGGLGGGLVPGGLPAPNATVGADPGPETSLIVKLDQSTSTFEDELGRNWTNAVRFSLPDYDVFEINATTLGENVAARRSGVGTILFNMAVNPQNGNIYVSNTEARNEVRFEGPGTISTTVRGRLHQARITLLEAGNVEPRHLNPHITYATVPQPVGTKNHSLATPLGMAVSSNGATLYVAAFGSSKVGVISTADLEDDSLWDGTPPDFDPTTESANYITVSGGGPSGLVLDETRGRLYVSTRFDNSVSVVDLGMGSEVDHVALHNPEPAEVVDGRPFLYDAIFTSSNGEASCSACHVFADFDSLGWDLGDPDGITIAPNPNPFPVVGPLIDELHPMKGPMTTQTLRGMVNMGPMHWRGDRTGGLVMPPSPLDSDLAFKAFNVAFGGLVGRDEGQIPDADMQKFADFILQVALPPNPVRNLDNSRTAAQEAGMQFFGGPEAIGAPISDFIATCDGCHELNPASGFFGGNGGSSFEGETQEFKVPHLRNMYEKVGMFGMPSLPFFTAGDNAFKGEQVRGFGFLHDGSTDTLFRFHSAIAFQFDNDTQIREVEQFMLAFDSDLAPMVGQQVTLTNANKDPDGGGPLESEVEKRIDAMITAATTSYPSQILGAGSNQIGLIAKATIGGVQRGWYYDVGAGPDEFVPDDGSANLTDAALRALASSGEITYTAVPPGSEQRMGVDQDGDGDFDGVDNCPSVFNDLQEDGDLDNVGDACDNCLTIANAGQADLDVDGHGNICDNCSSHPNNQCDTNSDGYGNACDADYNGDGSVALVPDFSDFVTAFGLVSVPPADTGVDSNCDGSIALVPDFSAFVDGFGAGVPGPSGLACAGSVPCVP